MLLDFFLDLEDFRRRQGLKYQIGHVLHFSVLAILSGADSYRNIHTFLSKKLKQYKRKFKVNWGKAPSYSTIRNIILGVDSIKLETAFRKHAEMLSSHTLPTDKTQMLAFDGKVIRGSFDHFKDQNAIQFLSVFCQNNNLILAHEEIDCKTNEIPVAQNLINKLEKANVLYTCDALSCQEKTLSSVRSAGSDIIVQVKNNQKALLNKCTDIASLNNFIDINKEPYIKAHGRIESRTASVFEVENLNEKWKFVESIIKIERERIVFNTKTKEWDDKGETSYYISTTKPSAEEANEIIRGHWGIENKNHHVKDATMGEDFSRIRVNPQNIARLRSIALNLMRYNKVKNIKGERYGNALDFEGLLKYKGL